MGISINGKFHKKTSAFKVAGHERIPEKVLDLIGNFTAETVLAYQFTNPANAATAEYSVDGGPWRAATTHTVTGISVGTHTLKVRGVNGHHVAGPESDPISFTVLPRPTQITDLTATLSGLDGINFAYTAPMYTDHVEYSLDGGPWARVPTVKTFTSLAQGTHTLKVRGVNSNGYAGPESAVASVTVVLVGTPTLTVTPLSDTSLKIAATAGANTASLEYQIDNGGYLPLTTNPLTLTGLSTQSHSVDVRGISSTSYRGSAARQTITLVPLASIVSMAANMLSTSSFNFSYTGSNGVVSVEYSLDGTTYTPMTNNPTTLTGMATGYYTVRLRAKDANGLYGPVSSQDVSIYAIPGQPGTPTITAISPTSFSFAFSAATGATSYRYSLDGLPDQSIAGTTVTLTGQSTSAHTLVVKGVNQGGVPGPASATASFQLYPLPSTPATPTTSAPTSTGFTLNYVLPTSAVAIQYSVDGGAFVQAASTTSTTLTGLTSATHTVVIRGVNANGLTGPNSSTVTITLAPTYSLATPRRQSVYKSPYTTNDKFGNTIAMNGDGTAVFSYYKGGIVVYSRSGNTYNNVGDLGYTNSTNFGSSIAPSSDGLRVAVGASNIVINYTGTALNNVTRASNNLNNNTPGYGTSGMTMTPDGNRLVVQSNTMMSVYTWNSSIGYFASEQDIDFGTTVLSNRHNRHLLDSTGTYFIFTGGGVVGTYRRASNGVWNSFNTASPTIPSIKAIAMSNNGLYFVVTTNSADRIQVWNRASITGNWTNMFTSTARSWTVTPTNVALSIDNNGTNIVVSADNSYSEVFSRSGTTWSSIRTEYGPGGITDPAGATPSFLYGTASVIAGTSSAYVVSSPGMNVNGFANSGQIDISMAS